MSIAGIERGWRIGYLVEDDGETYTYRTLPVVSLAANGDEIDAIVMEPGGKPLRADDIPGRAFAVAPGEDVRKVALAHAVTQGRKRAQLRADVAAA